MPKYANQFARPQYYEHEIVDEKGKKIGTVRIKPGSVQWKPANAQKFYGVSLDRFAQWMKDPSTGANQTKS